MIDDGLALSRWLLSALPSEAQTVLALPLLFVLLLVAMNLVVRLFPAFDRVLGPAGSGLATGLGMVVLLPEYLVTRRLRAIDRRPPRPFHTYGDAIENLVLMAHRVCHAGLSGFTTERRTRRALILTVLVVTVAVSNTQSCPATAGRCTTPVVAWWAQTKNVFDQLGEPDPKPKPRPTKKATRKPTPKPTAN